MQLDTAMLAQHVTAFLESPYKPFLMWLPFLPWAWVISSRLDKDARYFHFNWQMWNAIHLGAGAIALAVMVFVPIFWIGWPAGMIVLLTPILVYWRYRNQQVPENQRFALSGESMSARLDARRQARASRDAMLQFSDPSGAKRDVPVKDEPLFPVHMLAEDLILPALDARSSALEIHVGASGSAVAQVVDGVRYKRDPVPAEMGLRVIDYIKDLAGLDVADKRRRQTGTISMRGPNGTTELVVTTAGSSRQQILRLEFDRAKKLSRPFDNLGLLPSQLERLGAVTDKADRFGIVLVSAPAGNGLTTTMYSLVSRHDAFTSNIKTLEREVMLRIDGVDHVEWDPTNPDVDFATQLQSMMRRDPDVIMVDFIQDAETARIAVEPGRDGPLMYVPQRASSIEEQVRDWVKTVGDVKKAVKPLRIIMNQRLVRTLCPNCRQPYQPTADQLRKLNLPASKVSQLYRAGGKVQVKNKIENCPICGGIGYFGQIGIFQVMTVDDDARKLLSAGDLKGALAHARRNKMIYLQEAALTKVASGETSIEEIVRVTAPPKSESKAPPPTPAKA